MVFKVNFLAVISKVIDTDYLHESWDMKIGYKYPLGGIINISTEL